MANSKCEHVWHEFTRHYHTGGQTIVKKCIHCGQVSHEHFPPPVQVFEIS